MDCPDRLALWSLDQIAECHEGVDRDLYRALWEAMVEDPRDPEGWGPADFKAASPNALEAVWDSLDDTVKAAILALPDED